MSRTNKTGLDYFPLDTKLDEKFEMIEAEHGLVGFAIVIKIYQEIYKNGYYYIWNKKRQLLFSKKNNVYIEDLNVIINSALEWDMFSNDLFNKYNVLTSTGIQKQFLKITERRKKVIINENIWLFDNNEINANIIFINDDINVINTNIGTQSKVKESKVKESKVKETNIVQTKNYTELYKIAKDFLDYQKNQFGKAVNNSPDNIQKSIPILSDLIRLDGFSIPEIIGTLNFASNDDFWAVNVQSVLQLRKKKKGEDQTKFQKLYSRAGKWLKSEIKKVQDKEKQDKLQKAFGK